MPDTELHLASLRAALQPDPSDAPSLDHLRTISRRRRARLRGGAAIVAAVAVATTAPVLAGFATSDGAADSSIGVANAQRVTGSRESANSAESNLGDDESSYLDKWGGVRPEVIGAPLTALCVANSQVCGGVFYNDSDIKYYLRVVGSSAGAANLRSQAVQEFEKYAQDSNIGLALLPGTVSLDQSDLLVQELTNQDNPDIRKAGIPSNSFAAAYDPRDGQVELTSSNDNVRQLFKSVYGDRISVESPDEGNSVGGGFANGGSVG